MMMRWGGVGTRGWDLRAIFLELVRNVAFGQLLARVELLLQPRKVAHERSPVTDMRLSEAYASHA